MRNAVDFCFIVYCILHCPSLLSQQQHAAEFSSEVLQNLRHEYDLENLNSEALYKK